MTAFAVEVTLLLSAAFLLALAVGYRLAPRRRARADGPAANGAAPPTPVPPAVRPMAAERPLPESAPASSAEYVPRPLQSALPPPPIAPPPPEPDLFSRFGIINGTVPLPPEDDDEPPPRPPPRRRAPEHHPGTRPPALAAPEGEGPDDLKRLKGIGPQNEQRLNALGIYHFHQIAAWTPQEAAWIGSSLAFPGRIERENWVGQAKAILEGGAPPPGPRSRRR
ncbi:hypothetical protein ABLE93_05395 [Xanthobacter sp. KR7-65]|uniref:hypothetical protein n=1 Tax=Xanthobacter sp. KR7-65 TaxID=3156612 RepID=UPI0032B553F3